MKKVRRSKRSVCLLAALAAGWLACGEDPAAPPPVPPPPDPPRPTTLTVTPNRAELTALGATAQLSAEVRDQNGQTMAGVPVAWSSGDAAVATVDSAGLVTGIGRGETRVVARADGVSGDARVTVQPRVDSVAVVPPTDTIAPGDTLRLTATAYDPNGQPIEDAQFDWSSADSTVATVDSAGLVTAVGRGETRIVATADGVAGETRITVQPRVDSVAVVPPADTLAPGDTLRLTATAYDPNGQPIEDAQFDWSSADSTVATVDSAGLVTAVGRGETRIVATADGVAGETRITVQPRVDSVAVVPPADTLAPGDTLRLTATAYDPNGQPIEDAQFDWSSTDPMLATVDSSGLVRAISDGVTTIVASTDGAEGKSDIVVVSPDRAALVAFYHATGGPSWRQSYNWLTDAPLAQWFGVDTSQGRVTRLVLGSNDLRGPIPPEIGTLARLEWIELSENELLSGPIPPELGSLSSLESLWIQHSGVTGPIPSELGRLTNLRELLLPGNRLTGAIPPELGALANLERLQLDNNSLTGQIPPDLGKLDKVVWLNLGNNRLSGSIPPELGALASVEMLHLAYNELTGSIPPELGDLPNVKDLRLQGLSVSFAGHGVGGLTGPIPPELGRLATLEILYLGQNSLSGPIPPDLGNLTNLRELSVSANRFTAIPAELGKLQNLERFWMQLNPLSGPIPRELGNLANLKVLNLSLNPSLRGPIPREFGNLASLESLELWGNSLTGSIPPELGNLTNLGELFLQENQLSGPIPPALGALANLEVIGLAQNGLTGAVPMELGNLVSLASLSLRENRLTGIAGGLGGLRNLLALDLSNNLMTSDGLPAGVFADLPSLESLDLSGNQLRELPTGLFLGSPRLSRLRLDGNPGAPFTLTLEARRIDAETLAAPGPARLAIHLPEGAPVDLRIPLSAHGGGISANAVVLETGSDRSADVTVTPAAGSQTGTEVVAGPLPALPRRLSGLQLEVAGSLVLFGDVSNRAPVSERNLPLMRFREGDESKQILVSSYFDDPDGDELAYSAEGGGPAVVSVSVANGRLTVTPLATGSSTITVTATDAGGLAAEASLPVSVRGLRRGSYAIDLIMVDPPDEAVQAVFDDAVEYWESILADTELPDIPVGADVPLGCEGVTTDQSLEIIDDLAIVASVGKIDGRGGVLGWAALCGMREESRLPLIGALRFDADDLEVLQESDAMEEVIVHEIGHLLGIGTVWEEHALLISPSLPDSLGTDTHFRGPLAIAAFDDAGGEIYTGGEKVPVENFARRGSGDSHWRESVLDHELMTPSLSLGVPNPLSAMTIQSLADMGYTVDVSLAEPFLLPGAAARAPGDDVRKIEYGDDVRPGPIIVFGRDGRVVRVIPN